MPNNTVDLAGIFAETTKALVENQHSLNQADTYNQDHGNNMVQTFQVITQALQEKKGSSDKTALNFAAQQLSQNTTSGSGKLYAQNLAQAAGQLKGKRMDAQGALALLQTLTGGGQASQTAGQTGGGDLLGTLLGGLTGGSDSSSQQSSQSGGDLLGTLLGGLTGGGEAATQQPSQPGGDLLGTLLGGLTGGGGGGGGLQSLVQLFLGGSAMGDASHRTQSTQVVINAFLQALSAFTSKK